MEKDQQSVMYPEGACDSCGTNAPKRFATFSDAIVVHKGEGRYTVVGGVLRLQTALAAFGEATVRDAVSAEQFTVLRMHDGTLSCRTRGRTQISKFEIVTDS